MSQYTSESEFNLEKRVHITNEIPPYDMFDALNSVMQTTVKNGEIVPSIWQWILGYTKVEYDLPYLSEYYDETTDSTDYRRDIENEAVYYKMVNGEIAEEYGPKPKTKEEGIKTKYHRLEEYGVLLPEFDFLLHEAYRYLGRVYPDHPDYINLLTDNEFNDFISQAAAIIDYEPNNAFFDKLVTSLGLEKEEALKEAAMCKIRNLRNEAYRRKLYGSKYGYRMLANELLYTVTVFPVATYLPLRTLKNNDAQDQLDISFDLNKLTTWNIENANNLSSENYIKYIRQHDRKIDTFSKNYYKKLRLIDYDGSSSKYQEKEKDIKMFGIVAPLNEFTICEYPAQSDITSATVNIRNGLQCDINSISSFISEINPDESCVGLRYKNGIVVEETNVDREHHSFDVTSQQTVKYADLYVYPSMEEGMTHGAVPSTGIFTSSIGAQDPLYVDTFLDKIYNNKFYIGEPISSFVYSVPAMINPRYCDTLLLSPSHSLSYYPETVNYDRDEGYSSDINWDNCSILPGKVVSTDMARDDGSKVVSEAAEVIGFTKGKITIVPTSSEKSRTITAESHLPFIREDERYGIVIKTIEDKDVVLFGKITIEETLINSLYNIESMTFSISAIPDKKDEYMLLTLYGNEYTSLVNRISDLNETLSRAEVANSFNRELAKSYIEGDASAGKIIENSGLNYEEYLVWLKEYLELNSKLEDISENRKHVYDNSGDYEKSKINKGSQVSAVLIASSNVRGAYSLYDTLPAGTIQSISLGNLNCVSIISDGVVLRKSNIQFQKIGLNYYPTVKDYYKIRVQNNLWSQMYSNTTVKFRDSIVNYKPYNTICYDYDRTNVQIESTIDVSLDGKENMISFESDLAKELSKTLSVGDIVTGPTIDSDDEDVFITSVGDGYITLSQNLTQSGTFVLNYAVKTNTSIDDTSEDINLFKKELYTNNLYEEFNPFKNGLYPSAQWPNVSNAILDSLTDISLFKLHNVKGLYKTDSNGNYELDSNGDRIKLNKDTFTVIMEEVYYDLYKTIDTSLFEHNLLVPSDIKFNNELFVEFNLNKLLEYPSRTNVLPTLMSVDWLDYIDNSLGYSSKATDKVNIGVNLMMETDTSGYYTLISGQKYTDPNTRVKFITMNMNGLSQWPEINEASDELTIPVYAQLGTGGQGRSRWFRNIDDITYPNVWGVSVYDDYKFPKDIRDKNGKIVEYGYDEDSKFYEEGGELRRVTVYGQTFETAEEDVNSDYFKNIENPIMEIPLAEYDTIARYSNKETGSGLLTISNVSFYAQTFEGLLKYFEADTDTPDESCNFQILGTDMGGVNILEQLTYRVDSWYKTIAPSDIAIYNSNIAFLKGVKAEKDEEGRLIVPVTAGSKYVTITDSVVINKLQSTTKGLDSLSFEKGQVLIKFNDIWYLKNFQFVGLIGDGLDFDTPDGVHGYITSNTNLAPYGVGDALEDIGISELDIPTGFQNPEAGINVFERLLQYLARVNTDIPTSNLTLLNYYSYRDNNGVEPTEIKAGVPSTSVTNIEDALEFMSLVQNTNTHVVTTDGTELYQGTIPFFVYVGGEKYKRYFESQGINIGIGDAICLVNVGNKESAESNSIPAYQWQLLKINRSCTLGLAIPMTKVGNTLDTEYAAAIGDRILEYKYTDSEGKTYSVYTDTSQVSITNRIDSINSTFTLPRRFVTEGSYDFNFTIDPKFVGEGYLYNEDGSIDYSRPCTFNITKGSIYYDQQNESFYMYSNVINATIPGQKLEKIAIKFNEQKYFKNVLNTACVYQVKDSLESDKSTVTSVPTLSAIDDIAFNVDKIDVGDRLLKVEKIDLRSIYNSALEPVLFSNYLNIDYNIKGIKEDGTLYLSYIGQPENTAERINFAISVDKLLPSTFTFDNMGGTYTVTNYPESSIDFVNDNTVTYTAPTLKNVRFTKPLTQDGFNKPAVDREFKYFKNTLPFKAAVNLNNPSVLLAPTEDSDLFEKAISELSVGDMLVSAYALKDSPVENKLKISIYCDGNSVSDIHIRCIKFAKGMFMAITNNGIAYYNYSCDLSSLSEKVECKKLILSTNSANQSFLESESVVDLDFDYDTDTWLVEVKKAADIDEVTSMIYGFTPSDEADGTTGVLYMTPMYTDIARIITYKENEDNSQEIITAYSSGFGAAETVTIGDVTANTTDSMVTFRTFNDSVISGLTGETYVEDETGEHIVARPSLVYAKDVAIKNGMLRLDTEETVRTADVYEVDDEAVCGPYEVDTLELEVNGSTLPIADTINSRALVATDSTGRYQLYAKGRDLFIKSPTATVKKEAGEVLGETEYYFAYDGGVTDESYWKYARAPIFSDKERTIYRATPMDELSSYATNMGQEVTTYLDSLSTSTVGVGIDGRALNSNDESTLTQIKSWLSAYKTVASWEQFNNTLQDVMDEVEGSDITSKSITTSYGFRVAYVHESTQWTLKLYFPNVGFKEKTIADKLYTGGICYKNVAVLKSSGNDYEIDVNIKEDYTGFNFEAAYGDYVYVLSKLFGYNIDDTLSMSSNISKAQFTDNKLFLLDQQGFLSQIDLENLTKRDDIENINNWIVSSYPDNFVYNYVDSESKSYFHLLYRENSGIEHTITIPQYSNVRLNTTFKPVCSYIREDLIILGGYTLSKSQIREDYTALVGESHVNQEYLDSLLVNAEYEDASTPTVLYSNDGGVSFKKATLPSLGDVDLNYYITAIRFLNRKYYFYCSTVGNTTFQDNGYVLSMNDEGLYVFDTDIKIEKLTDEDKEYGISEQFDVDSSVGMRGRTAVSASVSANNISGTAPSAKYRIYITKDSSFFHIASSKAISTEDIVVTDKGQNFVTLSGNLLPTGDGSTDLLLAFNTNLDIINQYVYLNTDRLNSYINDWGDLKVAEVVEVDNKNYANRFYSYRELLTEEERLADKFGYPAAIEDEDKLYYTYTDVEDNDGNVSTNVDIMLNNFGSEIKLCDASGTYMFINHNMSRPNNFANRIKSENSFEIYDSAYNTKYSSVAEAEKDPNARKLVPEIMELLSDTKVRINKFDTDREIPYIIVNLNSDSNVLMKLEDLLFKSNEDFVTYINTTTPNNVTEMSISSIKFTDENDVEHERYTKRSYNGEDFWYDNLEEYYPINCKRYISSSVYMPYTHGGDIVRYTNTTLDNLYKQDSDIDLPITGVYLSNYGYGGTRNNEDLWKYTLPWLQDPYAFENDFVKNSNGDFIYLTDAIGNEIISYNAEMYIENGDEASLSRYVFGNKNKKTVTLSGTEPDGETPWDVKTEFIICDFEPPVVYSAYDLDSTGEPLEIKIYNGTAITEPLTFHEPFFVYKNGKNLYDELDDMDESGKKFKVELWVQYKMARDVISGYINADDFVSITRDTLSIRNISNDGQKLTPETFVLYIDGTNRQVTAIRGIHITYKYRGVEYTKDLPLYFTQNAEDDIPSPSIDFGEGSPCPVVTRVYDYTESKANYENGNSVTGKYYPTFFDFTTMQDNPSREFVIKFSSVEPLSEDHLTYGRLNQELSCNNPGAFSLTGPFIYNNNGESSSANSGKLVDQIGFLITEDAVTSYETRLLNISLGAAEFEITLPVFDVGNVKVVYYNDWDIKKRAVGQEEKRVHHFAVFLGDERLDKDYQFELVPGPMEVDGQVINTVECKMSGRNFVFDKVILEDNTETNDNRDDYRLKSWQAYDTIYVSNCGNDSSTDCHIIKFPIGVIDTYLGRFIGMGFNGFESWELKYNGQNVKDWFSYTYENNLPYLTSLPHAFDNDETLNNLYNIGHDLGRDYTLTLTIRYDYYEATMNIVVKWDNFYSSPRLIAVSPFVQKYIPYKNDYKTPPYGYYLMSEDLSYDTYYDSSYDSDRLYDFDNNLTSDKVPLTFELEQTLLPDYNRSQNLIDLFKNIINEGYDTFDELNQNIHDIKFNFDNLESVWNEFTINGVSNFGSVARLILDPDVDINDAEVSPIIDGFEESAYSALERNLGETIDKYIVCNLLDRLPSLRGELSSLREGIDNNLSNNWMNSNFCDIPTAVDNIENYIQTYEFNTIPYNFEEERGLYIDFDTTSNYGLVKGINKLNNTIDDIFVRSLYTQYNGVKSYYDSYRYTKLIYGPEKLNELKNDLDNYFRNIDISITQTGLNLPLMYKLKFNGKGLRTFSIELNQHITNWFGDSLRSTAENTASNVKWLYNTLINRTINNFDASGVFKDTIDLSYGYRTHFTTNNGIDFTTYTDLNDKYVSSNYGSYINIITNSAQGDSKKLVSKSQRLLYLQNTFNSKIQNLSGLTETEFNEYFNYSNCVNSDSLNTIKQNLLGIQSTSDTNWLVTLGNLETYLENYRVHTAQTYNNKSAPMDEVFQRVYIKDSLNNNTSTFVINYDTSIGTPEKNISYSAQGLINEDTLLGQRWGKAYSKSQSLATDISILERDKANYIADNINCGALPGILKDLKLSINGVNTYNTFSNKVWANRNAAISDILDDISGSNLKNCLDRLNNNQTTINRFIDNRNILQKESSKYSGKSTYSNYYTTNKSPTISSISIPTGDIEDYISALSLCKNYLNSAFNTSTDQANWNAWNAVKGNNGGTWKAGWHKQFVINSNGTKYNTMRNYRASAVYSISTYSSLIKSFIDKAAELVNGLKSTAQSYANGYNNARDKYATALNKLKSLVDNTYDNFTNDFTFSRLRSFNADTGEVTYSNVSIKKCPDLNSVDFPIISVGGSVPAYDNSLSFSSVYNNAPRTIPTQTSIGITEGGGKYNYVLSGSGYSSDSREKRWYWSDWYTNPSWGGELSLASYVYYFSTWADNAINILSDIKTKGNNWFYYNGSTRKDKSWADGCVTNLNNYFSKVQTSILNYYVSDFDPNQLFTKTYGMGPLITDCTLMNLYNDSSPGFWDSWYNYSQTALNSIRSVPKLFARCYIFRSLSVVDPNYGKNKNGWTLEKVSVSGLDEYDAMLRDTYVEAWLYWNETNNVISAYDSSIQYNTSTLNVWNQQLDDVRSDNDVISSARDTSISLINSIHTCEDELNCRTSLNSYDYQLANISTYSTDSTRNRKLPYYKKIRDIYNEVFVNSNDIVKDESVVYYNETGDNTSIKTIPKIDTSTSSSYKISQVNSRIHSTIVKLSEPTVSSIKSYVNEILSFYSRLFQWSSETEQDIISKISQTYQDSFKWNVYQPYFINYTRSIIDNTDLTSDNNTNRFTKKAALFLRDNLVTEQFTQTGTSIQEYYNNIHEYILKTQTLYNEIYKLIWHSDDVYTGRNSSWMNATHLNDSFGLFNNILKSVEQYYTLGKEFNPFQFTIKDIMDVGINNIVVSSYNEADTNISSSDPNVQWQGYIGRIFTYYLHRLYNRNCKFAQTEPLYPLDNGMTVENIKSDYVLSNYGGPDNTECISLKYTARFNTDNDVSMITFNESDVFRATPNLGITSISSLERTKNYKEDINCISQKIVTRDVDASKITTAVVSCGAISNTVQTTVGTPYAWSEEEGYLEVKMPNPVTSTLRLPLFLNSLKADESTRIKRAIKSIVGNFKYYLDTDGEPFVLYQGVDKVTFDVVRLDINLDENVYINGIEGPVMLKKPKYNSFYDLIKNEGYVIVGDTLVSTAARPFDKVNKSNPLDTTKTLANFGLKNSKGTSIQLTNNIVSNLEDLNDGEPHFIRIKVFTQSSILPESTSCNDPDNYEELNLKDYDKFTPDRVWFNELGYPLPPIQIDNNIFNPENNYAYTDSQFKNNNGYSVYRCNENGQIIGYSLLDSNYGGVIKEEDCDGGSIKRKSGSISKGAKSFVLDGTIDLENAHIPNKPKYISCIDWFKNGFYLQGHEANPFWQVLKISSNYNSSKEGWKQYYKVMEYNRATNDMSLVEVEDGDKFVNISNTVIYKKDGEVSGNIEIDYSKEFIDLKSGKINFVMLRPDTKYKETQFLIKYGITAKNTFCMGEDTAQSSIWTGGECKLSTYAELNYTVNSTKAYENSINTDSDIVEATELGLFNKNHELIAYAIFPPIEFHTDSQHASFTCYVKNGNLSPIDGSEQEGSSGSSSEEVVSSSSVTNASGQAENLEDEDTIGDPSGQQGNEDDSNLTFYLDPDDDDDEDSNLTFFIEP